MRNNQRNSLKLFAATLVLSVFIFSCKKEEADDPNIIYTAFNKTLTMGPGISVTDSIDLNLDTKKDFAITAGQSSDGDTAAAYLLGYYSGGYIDSTSFYGSVYQAVALPAGQAPDPVGTAKKWRTFVICALKRGTSILGFAGAGDKYIPVVVQNTLTSKVHYGWVRVNVNSDYSTFKVIDGAYNLVPEIPVKMGAK